MCPRLEIATLNGPMDETPVNQSGPVCRQAKLQFSLRSLLVATAGVSVFCSLVSAGWYTSAFWCLATSGIFMMAFDIVLGRVSRTWATGLLLAGICYAAANMGVFLVTMSHDAFAIFDLAYIIPAAFGGPGLMILVSILVAGVSKRLHWFGVLGFATWIGCVGFAHLWVIAQCSASV